jgi:hypothetical protein
MPFAEIKVGREHGSPFQGINEKVSDHAQAPAEAAAGQNWRVNNGVLETRPGYTRAYDFTRPTNYYVTLDGTNGIRFPAIASYKGLFETPRWSIVFSIRTPNPMSAGWIMSKRVTIGGTDFTCGLKTNGSGQVTAAICDSARADKSFTSGATVLAAGTNYILQWVRYDTNSWLYFGEPDSTPVLVGTSTVLGLDDAPTDTGDHDIVIGNDWTGAAWSLPLDIEAHEISIFRKVLNHQKFGYTSLADPRDSAVILHCRFEDASGNLTDLSSHENDATTVTGVASYQDTSHSFMEETSRVDGIFEFTQSDGTERIVTIHNGTIQAADYHV